MLKRFKESNGIYIADIAGQVRLAYSLSSNIDFYDLQNWPEQESCPGMILRFFDLHDGNVYQPFESQEGVIYGEPLYAQGCYWFLQAIRPSRKIVLYRYQLSGIPEAITGFSMDAVDTYNFSLMGDKLHVTSQNHDTFVCYYPERFAFSLGVHETAVFIDDDKVYLENWIEEGWDSENDRPGEDYRFYDEVIVRNFQGDLLSRETGTLYQSRDGSWWIG